jgi:hypothetical protein
MWSDAVIPNKTPGRVIALVSNFVAYCELKTGIMIFYRILCVIINMFCAFIAVLTIFSLPFVMAYPPGLLAIFLMLCMVLYGWFANRFYVFVMLRKQKMSKRQKDWLQVNALVSFIFAVLSIGNCVYLYYKPGMIDKMLSSMPVQEVNSKQLFLNIMLLVLVLFSLMAIHIIWTYILIRKHKEYFAE